MTLKYIILSLVFIHYICRAQNYNTPGLVSTNEDFPGYKIVYPNETTVTLLCIVSSPAVFKTWLHNDTEIDKMSSCITWDNESKLKILDFNVDTDLGSYACVYTNNRNAEQRKNFKLIVHPTAKLVDTVNVLQGTKFVLHCMITGHPIPAIQWFIGNNTVAIIGSTEQYILSEGEGIANAILTIENMTLNDTNVYKCRATNLANSVNGTLASAKVNVFASYVDTNYEVPGYKIIYEKKGNDFIFECNVSALVTFKHWLKDGKAISKSDRVTWNNRSKLQIKTLTDSDSGNYTCVTELMKPENLSNVSYLIKFEVVVYQTEFKTVNVQTCEDVTLHCASIPRHEMLTKLHWITSKETVITSTGRYLLQEDHGIPNSIFTIESAKLQDQGEYKCFATSVYYTDAIEITSYNVVFTSPSYSTTIATFLGLIFVTVLFILLCIICCGKSVLKLARRFGHIKAVKCLIHHGSNFNDEEVVSLPLEAATNGKQQYLVQPDASVINWDSIVESLLLEAASKGYKIIVQYLVENGASVNDNVCRSVLHLAARLGHLDVLKCLLKHGANINDTGNRGKSVLHVAASCNHVDIIKYVIEHGANVNYKDNKGRSVLHVAASWGHLDTLKYLVEHDANVEVKDKRGRSVLHMAARWGHLDVIKYLVECFGNINDKDKKGRSVLHLAAKWGNLDSLKYLVEHGANVNCQDNRGSLLLHVAASCGQLDIIKYVIEQGANVNYKDSKGRSVLHVAACWAHLDTLKYLIERGANVNDKDNKGMSVLQMAARCGDLHTVKYVFKLVNDKEIEEESVHYLSAILGQLHL